MSAKEKGVCKKRKDIVEMLPAVIVHIPTTTEAFP